MTEHVFILLFTGAQHHELDIILTQFIHNIGNQVKALLIGQTGYDTDDQCLIILIQSEISLKRTLVFYFSLRKLTELNG